MSARTVNDDELLEIEIVNILIKFRDAIDDTNRIVGFAIAKEELIAIIHQRDKARDRQTLLDEAISNREGLNDMGPFTGQWIYDYFDARVKQLERSNPEKGIV